MSTRSRSRSEGASVDEWDVLLLTTRDSSIWREGERGEKQGGQEMWVNRESCGYAEEDVKRTA